MNVDKLKEEILNRKRDDRVNINHKYYDIDVFDAMSEYAEQISILFGEWILKEAILSRDINWFDAGKHYTTKELLHLFIKHLNEQQAIDADTLEK